MSETALRTGASSTIGEDARPESQSPLKNPVVVGVLFVVGSGLLIRAAIWFVNYRTRGRFVVSTTR